MFTAPESLLMFLSAHLSLHLCSVNLVMSSKNHFLLGFYTGETLQVMLTVTYEEFRLTVYQSSIFHLCKVEGERWFLINESVLAVTWRCAELNLPTYQHRSNNLIIESNWSQHCSRVEICRSLSKFTRWSAASSHECNHIRHYPAQSRKKFNKKMKGRETQQPLFGYRFSVPIDLRRLASLC